MPALRFSKQAAAFLERLSAKHSRQIAEKLQALSQNPDSVPSDQLKGYAPMRRIKSGEFRVIYALESGVLRIRLIGKRNDDDIYKALARGWKK